MNPPTHSALTIRQAAEQLGVSTGTIRRWAQSNYITGFKVGTRGDWRFTPDALRSITVTSENTLSDINSNTASQLTDQSALSFHTILQERQQSSHFVQFYEDEEFLVNSLSDYVAGGLSAGEACVIIATSKHIDAVEKKLASNPEIDLAYSQWHGYYFALDAHDTLAKFMVNGHPNPTKFSSVMNEVIGQIAQRQIPIRAFGEMVALLWADENQEAVIELEQLWNDLAKSYTFKLFCAYPLAAFNKQGCSSVFAKINHTHSHTLPAESYSMLGTSNERRQAISSLQQKAGLLDDAVAQCKHLSELNESKDEFISIASHQLRTPATSVKQYAGLLLQGFSDPLTDNQRELLELAYESNERQLKIIDDLLKVASLDAGKITLENEHCDINQILRDVIQDQKDMIDKRTQTLTLTLTNELSAIADPRYLRMVFENLLSNASKYSLTNATLEITTRRDDDSIYIDFSDNGIGISPEDQPRLFQKFSRINNIHSRTVDGNGLGLYWSKKIIDLHGGKLSLVSQAESGSTFSVQLPIHTTISSLY